MTYAETLDYLYNTLPMFSRMGSAAFKKDLTNTRLLCEHLGNPQQKFKTIHVGGTNGKGSVSHMLAAVFQHCGYKTGLYTSPHLYDFRERIKLNGWLVPDEFVVRFISDTKPLIERLQPSFFEITVAMAFHYFAEEKVDIAIIEVGLGGRLDSTNIIHPELSLITNIGWDHMNMLGNSLEEIAFEKAGIIKEAVPVVIGEKAPETTPVFEQAAREKGAPLYFAEDLYTPTEQQSSIDELTVTYKKKNDRVLTVTSGLPGVYQVKNLQTALTAIEILRSQNWLLPDENTLAALTHAKTLTGLSGRWEVVHRQPAVVLEVAHNKNGIEQMLQQVLRLSFSQLHLVFGMVKDKDAASILSLLPPNARYYFAAANIPRALPAEELKTKAAEWSLDGNSHADVNLALKAAITAASTDDLIIVCGSIFLVAEVDRDLFAV